MSPKNSNQDLSACLRKRKIYSKLNNTRQSRAVERQHAAKIQILRKNYQIILKRVLPDSFIRGTRLTDFSPVPRLTDMIFQKIGPGGRQVLIDQDFQEANKSWVSPEARSAAKASTAGIDSGGRYG